MQISFAMPIFLLFPDQISGGGQKSPRGDKLRPPPPIVEEASISVEKSWGAGGIVTGQCDTSIRKISPQAV